MIFVADVQRVVAEHYGVSVDELCAHDKRLPLCRQRQVAMFLSRKMTGKQTTVIGQKFNRDHSTIVNGTQVIQRLCVEDVAFAGEVSWIEAKIAVDNRRNGEARIAKVGRELSQLMHNCAPFVRLAE